MTNLIETLTPHAARIFEAAERVYFATREATTPEREEAADALRERSADMAYCSSYRAACLSAARTLESYPRALGGPGGRLCDQPPGYVEEESYWGG